MHMVIVLYIFGFFILVFMIVLILFVIFYNMRTKTILDRFIFQAESLNPIIFENIELRYWTNNGGRMEINPFNRCNLFLFENCLAIVRRQEFIGKVLFPPILLTSDITLTKDIFNYLKIYKPEHILSKKIINGEVDIILSDPIYKHYKIDITLMGLSEHQIDQLDKIKSWSL